MESWRHQEIRLLQITICVPGVLVRRQPKDFSPSLDLIPCLFQVPGSQPNQWVLVSALVSGENVVVVSLSGFALDTCDM